jgi:hypothetical protein
VRGARATCAQESRRALLLRSITENAGTAATDGNSARKKEGTVPRGRGLASWGAVGWFLVVRVSFSPVSSDKGKPFQEPSDGLDMPLSD